jgi:hypothetical protein
MENAEDRIEVALDIAWKYGQTDGAHHKMWVIDQMVRILCGDSMTYQMLIGFYEQPVPVGKGEDDYYQNDWDTGIAP